MEWFYLYLVTKIGWILLPDQTHASEMQKFGLFDGIFLKRGVADPEKKGGDQKGGGWFWKGGKNQ